MTLSPHAGPGAGVPGPGAPIGPEPAVDDGPTLDQGLPETAALLRAALRSVADVVHPSPNGLERILARAHADEATLPAVTGSDAGRPTAQDEDGRPGRSGVEAGDPVPGPARRKLATVEIETSPRPPAPDPVPSGRGTAARVPRPRGARTAGAPGRSWWAPTMAAAAVLAVLAGGLGGVRLGVFRAPDLAAVVGGWSASGDARPPAPPPLPVYLIAQRQGRWALVREFTPTTLTRPDDRLGAALRFAVAGAGHAPDLASVWSVEHLLGDVRAEVRAAEVVVRLSATLLGESHQPVSGPARPTLARLAVQQLVWTATAVLGRDAPVRVEGPTPTSVLFDTLPLNATFARGTGATDPRAPIWLSSVTDGQQVRAGALQVSGDALTTGTGTISWALTDAAGTVVARGQEVLRRADGSSPPPRAGERAVFQIHVTLPARGHYVIAVTQDWPSAGDPGATWTDTKTLQAA